MTRSAGRPASSTCTSAAPATSWAFLWDTLHTYRHGETAEETWAQLGERIKLVHVKDSVKATPDGFDFALTGEGTVPVMSFIDLLERKGYDGYVNFEWEKGWHRRDPGAGGRAAALRAYCDAQEGVSPWPRTLTPRR